MAINTAAVHNPSLIQRVAQRFGSQCMVLSIEARKGAGGKWEVCTECGRETTGIDVVDWAIRGSALGAGEILITSIDREGTRKGFDIDLVAALTQAVDIPIIASGGYGEPTHFVDLVKRSSVDGVAFADALHYDRIAFKDLRFLAYENEIKVRQL